MRLLLAEDERSLSRALRAILERSNYTVDTVLDGEEAWQYLEYGSYDGIILDIMMPKLDGIAVLRRLRERGDLTPVLLLTAKAEVEDKVLGLDSGANDYLTKPFHAEELLARVRAMTREKAAQPDVRLGLGNLTLDCASFELSAEEGVCRLSNKEFQIMELLLRNRKRLLSAEHLMRQIWSYDSEADSNVVWVNISYLRRKLQRIGANVQIRAVRNAGYTLEVSE